MKLLDKIITLVFILIVLAFFASLASASSLQLSVVDTQGNTESQTISLDGEHTFTSQDKTNTQEMKAGLLYGEVNGERAAESWYSSLKDSHYMLEWWYWYSMAGFESDAFAGYDLRVSINIGNGLRLKNERHEFKIEVGPGIVYEERPDGDEGFVSTRAWQSYSWHVTEKITVNEQAEYLYNYSDPDDYRINAEGGLTGKVNDTLSLKIGPKIRYVNLPPEGKKRTDIITAATVIVSF